MPCVCLEAVHPSLSATPDVLRCAQQQCPVLCVTPKSCLNSGLAALQDYAKLKLLVKQMIELKDRPELEEVTDRLV